MGSARRVDTLNAGEELLFQLDYAFIIHTEETDYAHTPAHTPAAMITALMYYAMVTKLLNNFFF